VIHGKPEQVTQMNGFAQISSPQINTAYRAATKTKNLYGAQPPSAAGNKFS